tara:strand:- start:11359 stop:11514 length:156 start_codon:yes stop_codon:yes gene_type:complete
VKEEKKFRIPESGNLGLLALGYRGVEAWREVRDKEQSATSLKSVPGKSKPA